MVQRNQTLYLTLVFILSILLLTGPLAFISTDEGGIFLRHSGVKSIAGDNLGVSTWPLTVMISISALLSIVTIFFFKKRPLQMRLTAFQMIFNLGIIGVAFYYVMYIMHNFDGIQFGFQWRIVIPPVMFVLQIMAFLGIRKDELLIKAYDRIR